MAEKTEQKGANPNVQFRCDRAIVEEFERNIASMGWTMPKVGKELLESVNALFRTKKKPDWPLIVVDATDVAGGETEPTREEVEDFRAYIAAQFEKNLEEIRAMMDRDKNVGAKGRRSAKGRLSKINPPSENQRAIPSPSQKSHSA